jgi:restriction system protein
LAWSRTYLKKFGLLENSSRGIWSLTKADVDVSSLDANKIVQYVRNIDKPDSTLIKSPQPDQLEIETTKELSNSEEWKTLLLDILYQLTLSAFERLAQRLLRESGFLQVDVTGKVGDGGIDGKGIVRVSGLLSFHVIFQCKRYKGSVTPDKIRDFRGAMQGRADKGLFITTGSFTRDAIKEATRDGAPPIDLIDGETVCDKLKELGLGIDVKLTETIQINSAWFNAL